MDHITEDVRKLVLRGFDEPVSEEEFNDLACRVFTYQFERNAPYREFSIRRGVLPSGVPDYREIPAVPVSAFKELTLACFPERDSINYFQTSGTTQGKQGRHYIKDYFLYENSLKNSFRHFILPDCETMEMVILSVPPSLEPHSSLIHMFETVRNAFGDEESCYYMDDNGVSFDKLFRRLRELEKLSKPVCLLGASLAFGIFLEWCGKNGVAFRLPEKSRLMDTGGSKGKHTEIPRDKLISRYNELFCIPAHAVINEYGMTELFSQYFDTSLRSFFSGKSYKPDVKAAPPWLRTVAVNHETGVPLPAGEKGLLRHYDLANIETVMAVDTEDIGMMREGRLILMGRDLSAEPRGCSLLIEEMTRKI